MDQFTPLPRLSKRTHIAVVGLLYAAPLGLFVGYRLDARGDWEPVVVAVLVLATVVTGAVRILGL